QSVQAVLVVPCGALAGLPFAALWDGSGHLVERRDFVLAASVETALRRRAPASAGALAPNARVVAIADTTRLPGAAAEVAALHACWPNARVHSGDDATRAALHAEAAQADLLHLACHGEFRADSPLFSALHLFDGALTALDAERLPLAAPLVVLSGCETALSHAARDDEALGLVRAFLIAGAGRVLGGLWAVQDAATARWMAAFHARLAAGMPPPQALGDVQRGLIAAGEHPFVWAAFVMHGQG
ncbi:MAG: CHAT domain-containing protein, partial [Piscinibacter sp.]|nr:CHAT domain-containing protein [Piscinibacter sp.]